MHNNAVQLWSEVLSVLKQEIPAQSFETWLKPTRAVMLSDEQINVEVPNKFFKEWLLDHYYEMLCETLTRIASSQLRIDFIVGTTQASQIAEKIIAGISREKTPSEPRHKPDVYLNPKYTFDSFVVGPSNRFAHAASSAVAESPARAYNPLFIYGGVGLGKTHLMQAVGHFILEKTPGAKLSYTTSERFTNQLINAIQTRTTMRFREKYRNVDILLIDDIQFIAGKESTQEEFFHTFNTLYDAHKQIILSSDRSPKDIPGLEERLISRFEWGLVTDIQPPDLETRIAILRKKAEREIVKVPDDVMFFIAEKIHSNIRELEGSLIRVVAYSLLTNNQISIAVAEEVLKDAIKEDAHTQIITIDCIQKVIAENFDIRISDIKKEGRKKIISYPRQIAMFLARELTNHSLSEIGEYFGGRDHTTVLHAYEKIRKLSKINTKVKDLLTSLINKIETK
ncbi:MAG: chromosomal replication initiator protein DnaA [Candidatus Omnitrophica bacterium]|nr:chromosomal replication initiator protein DnaA [Candidatus Omnitrophota bacterium]MBU4479682.1 chromosomal replication initiator protein DnaA [Candidatus Omnitrophota bacterium]MCG2703106.1 chromosomal replication initiator protein DnaA [Candidatus Omnitrophota bacterium]